LVYPVAVAGDGPEHGADLVRLVYFSLGQCILVHLIAVAGDGPEHGADPFSLDYPSLV
jgi:hypothetical protein